MDGATGAGTPEPEVRLLGPIEVARAANACALGGPKPRALLAVLALEPGRVVSVDRLVEALWPGDPPETAAHAVQVYVSQLRKALGPVIATRAPGYVLELAPEHVDVHRFTRLAQEGRAALVGGRSGRCGGRAARGARPLARAGARGLPLRAFRAERDRATRGAPHGRARGAHRRRPRAGSPRRARLGARSARRKRSRCASVLARS